MDNESTGDGMFRTQMREYLDDSGVESLLVTLIEKCNREAALPVPSAPEIQYRWQAAAGLLTELKADIGRLPSLNDHDPF